jgi:hypothetical protein
MKWLVPRIWEGETVAILGGGPSLTLDQVESTKALKRIATNNAFLLDPTAEILCWGDYGWFARNQGKLAEFKGLKVTWSTMPGAVRLKQSDEQLTEDRLGIHRLMHETRAPLSVNPRLVAGANTGHGAMNLAVLLGAQRILLLGFDMTSVRGHNWHTDHPAHASEHRYTRKWIPEFAKAKTILDRLGVEVINCTPGSALQCFPFAKIEDFIPVHA